MVDVIESNIFSKALPKWRCFFFKESDETSIQEMVDIVWFIVNIGFHLVDEWILQVNAI
jgi:hypothetical protein